MPWWSRWRTLAWLDAYRAASDLPSDAMAGITVAVMLIPQGMAYALLAGLPPVVGLYASVLPLVAYAAFGTSRQLSVGPVAMDSLLVATGASLVATPGTPAFLGAAVLLALMVGVSQAAMGALRLGFLVNFLSRPVISGFTSAAAIVIGLSQLQHLLGVKLGRSSTVHGALGEALPRLADVHLLTLALGAGALLMIIGLRRLERRLPGALIAVAVTTLLSFWLELALQGVAVVGDVPAGLPSFSVPAVSWDDARTLLPSALMIALIGFMEAISVAKALAAKHRYEVDANRELVGLGAANIAAAFTGGYPVSGGFSRSAVNDQAGAKSPVASLVTAGVIAVSLAFLTPLFYHLPKAVLAAIVMSAVGGLVDVREPIRLWRVRQSDAVLLLATFAVTSFVGIGEGIVVGVVASLGAFIYRSTRPHTAELGRLPGTNVFRNFRHFDEAEPVPGVLILRMDASFYFANVAFFKDRLDAFLREAPADVHSVLLDCSSMNDLDSSAEQALQDTVHRLRESGRDMYLANVKGPVRQVMQRSGLWKLLGSDHIYLDLAQAVGDITGERERQAASACSPRSELEDRDDGPREVGPATTRSAGTPSVAAIDTPLGPKSGRVSDAS